MIGSCPFKDGGRCLGKECALFDDFYECCSISGVSFALAKITQYIEKIQREDDEYEHDRVNHKYP